MKKSDKLTQKQLRDKSRLNVMKQDAIDGKISLLNGRILNVKDKKNKLNESLLSLQQDCSKNFGHKFINNICENCQYTLKK